MTTDLIDDLANCEASPYNLAVDHFAVAMANEIIVQDDIRNVSQYTLTDAYHALYASKVEMFENPDPVASAWWQEFFRSEEASRLRSKTVGNHRAAREACIQVARNLDGYKKIVPPTKEGEDESFESLRRRLNSVRMTAEAANGKAEEAIAIAQGMSDVANSYQMDRKTIEDMERRLKRSATLRKILDLGGAMLRYRKGAKRRKIDGFDKVSAITTSGDLTKLLPSEIMQLAGPPILAANTMRRLVENQTLAMKKYSYEKAGKGPIVVLLDESSSMNGEPIEQAKALAYAMAQIAKEQGRWICFYSFSSRRSTQTLVMAPDQWDILKLFEYLEYFLNVSYTDFDVLYDVMTKWDDAWKLPKGKADILFVTDGGASFGDDLVQKFTDFKKKREVRCYGMAIGQSVCDLPLVCDKAWTTATMGLESNAIREVLTI